MTPTLQSRIFRCRPTGVCRATARGWSSCVRSIGALRATACSVPVVGIVISGGELVRCPVDVTFALMRARSERRGAVTSGGGARGP